MQGHRVTALPQGAGFTQSLALPSKDKPYLPKRALTAAFPHNHVMYATGLHTRNINLLLPDHTQGIRINPKKQSRGGSIVQTC